METTEEIYVNFVKDYYVSKLGNVIRVLKSGEYRELKPSITSGTTYKYIKIRYDGKSKNIKVHHMVSHCFIGPRPPYMVVDHIDRNKHNNSSDNLRYVTYSENAKNIDKNAKPIAKVC